MARPKNFTPEDALDQAIELFWHRGYGETSIQDLVEHLGLNRGSLYATFGGKKALFLAALERYKNRRNGRLAEILGGITPVQEAFRSLLEELATESLAERGRRGCLLTNTAAELAPHDPDIAAVVADNRLFVEGIFREALASGQRRGELPATADATALAQFFFSTIQGIRVLAKMGVDRPVLDNVVRVALSGIT